MQLSEEQIMISDMAGAFSNDQLRPNAEKWDREKMLDRSVLKAMAELGFAGIYTKKEFGGSSLSRLDAVLIFEQLSRGCISHASFLSIHNMATWMVDTFGDDELRAKYVPELTQANKIISYCLTEPGGRFRCGEFKNESRARRRSLRLEWIESVYLGRRVFRCVSGHGANV